jgi:hypothetical protein
MIEKQNYHRALSSKGKRQLLAEKESISLLQEQISKNPCINMLSTKQQRRITKKGEWRLSSWKEIGLSAGLDEIHAQVFYSYLCGYSHAGNQSVLQLRNAQTAETQKTLCAATINLMAIAAANMIKSYCRVFPNCQSILDNEKDLAAFVDFWVSLGSMSTQNGQND